MGFITTLETINYCKKAFKLDVRESMNHTITMRTTGYVDPFEFNENLVKAIDYIEAQNDRYASYWTAYQWIGRRSNAIVKFREISQS